MSAKVQWVDCKASDAAILDTFEASCSEHQVFIVHYSLHRKISKACHRPRYQMYAEVRPSQDNRFSQNISVSCIAREIFTQNEIIHLFRIYIVDLGHMFPGHVIIF